MSAWIVSRAHIDALVLAGVQFGVVHRPSPRVLAVLGADLWRENHQSVNYLYDSTDEVPGYAAPTVEVLLDPVAVVKLVDCYRYQSCEHPAWETSDACTYTGRLRDAAMAGVPAGEGGFPENPLGWSAAPWGINDLTEAAAAPSTVDLQRRVR